METSQSILQIPSNPPLYLYIVLPIITLYVGIYMILHNHYILRPKLQPLIARLSISSQLAIQILIDILSNMSFITYAISVSFLATPSDSALRLLCCYDMFWVTLGLAIVMFGVKKQIQNGQEQVNYFVLGKNVLLLLIGFGNIVLHYVMGLQIISLPSVFAGLYLISLILTYYQHKFLQFIQQLLSLSSPTPIKQINKFQSSLPPIQTLSQNHPVSQQQLQQQIVAYSKHKLNKQHKNAGCYASQIARKNCFMKKIDTKLVASQKLMRICMAVHISLRKKENQEITAVKQYYGFMNGTLTDSGPIKEKNWFRHRKTFFNNRNKDKLTTRKMTRVQSSEGKLMKSGSDQSKNKLSNPDRDDYEAQDIVIDNMEPDSVLFYLFPVRLFESNKIISAIFSIVLNLGFGILLSYTQILLNTLKYGRFAQLALSLFLLPLIPSTSPALYLNTMVLSTLWKLGICGILTTISTLTTSSDMFTMTWQTTPYLQYQAIMQIVVIILATAFVIAGRNYWKIVVLAFLGNLGGYGWVTYIVILSSNS